MRTLRDAAALLAAAHDLDRLAPIAAALGFDEDPAPLDLDARRALALEACITEARICSGAGVLRALLVSVRADAALADALRHVAHRLSRHAPHALWIVLATQGEQRVGIAAWGGDRHPPRVAALVCERERVRESDAESLRALAAATGERHDLLVHARWVEILGRDALSRRFYRELERAVDALAHSSDVGTMAQRREVALLVTSRLLFLAFVQALGWLNGDRDYLARRFERCMASGGGFHRRVLLPLFFGTLNTPVSRRAPAARALGRIPFLNGGLFSRTTTERLTRGLRFSDDALGAIVAELFARFRFTAREESTDWSEAAIDPEMLGHTFETLMASERRLEAGAFFTPQQLVAHIVDTGLEQLLARRIGTRAARALCGDEQAIGDDGAALAALDDVTIVDPACGSGAFLVHALDRLTALRRRAGDARAPSVVRRELLARSVFGVDRDATAVWLCELRLWLSIVIDSTEVDPHRVPPLPNLDRNIRVGDALAGPDLRECTVSRSSHRGSLGTLRLRYARASGARKRSLARALDAAERSQALVLVDRRLARAESEIAAALDDARSPDLFGARHGLSSERRRAIGELRRGATALRREKRALRAKHALPLSFPVHFADVAARGGFSMVVGNPPWVRMHRIPSGERVRLRETFEVMRAAAWREGALAARAGTGFGGQVDLASLFIERALNLAAPGGVIAQLVPVKLWQSLAGGGVRRLLRTRADVLVIEDRRDAAVAFDAVVYPSVLIASRRVPDEPPPLVRGAHVGRLGAVRWRTAPDALALDPSPASPWILAPRIVRDAFDRLRAAGTPLAESSFGAPLLGVKCGLNDAFLVTRSDPNAPSALLRPALRGSGVRAWRPRREASAESAIVWTHDARGEPLPLLDDRAARWFAPWRGRLLARSDLRVATNGRDTRWWSLFRTDAADASRPRVVWSDFGRAPRALMLAPGDTTVPLNTCYVVRAESECDAFALTALLNGPVAAAWLALIAEPARGGHHRYLAWTMSLLPLPSDWPRARRILSPLGERGHTGTPPHRDELLAAALDAYQVERRVIAPLLAWTWDAD